MAKGAYIGVSGVARKVKKGYIGVDGVAHNVKKIYIGDANGKARLCWSGSVNPTEVVITYSGNMTDQVVTMSGKQYRLLTLTNSGTLTFSDKIETAEVWMCGGGTSGSGGIKEPDPKGGGGGAGAYTASGAVKLEGSMTAIVGSGGAKANVGTFYNAGSASSFGGISTPVSFSAGAWYQGVSGGTGGGSATSIGGYTGKGDGVSKYPFGDTSYFPNPHCAGGGAGSATAYYGGNGGSNGGSGSNGKANTSSISIAGGRGGNYGGGTAGTVVHNRKGNVYSAQDGGDGTFYGSAGAGGGSVFRSSVYNAASKGGAGYQGIIYIRIPLAA